MEQQTYNRAELEDIIRGIVGDHKRPRKSDVIDRVVNSIAAYQGSNGRPFIATSSSGSIVPLKGPEGREHIRAVYREIANTTPLKAIITEIIDQLMDKSASNALRVEPRVYVDRNNSRVYHDLNKEYCIRVSEDGIHRTKSVRDFAFHRGTSWKPIPDPDMTGTINDWMDCLKSIESEDIRKIIVVYATHIFSLGRHRLILYVHGPSLSGKSSLCQMIAHILDPHASEMDMEEMAYQNKIRDLMSTSMERAIMMYGNEGATGDVLAKLLCKMATGGAYSETAHYHQDITYVYEALRPVIINSLHFHSNEDDFIKRCIPIAMTKRADNELDTDEFCKLFDDRRDKLLGAVYKAVLTGIRNWNTTPPIKGMGRYGEFCRWGEAIASGWEWGKGEFTELFARHIANAYKEAAKTTELVYAIKRVLTQHNVQSGEYTTFPPPGGYRLVDEPIFANCGEMVELIRLYSPTYSQTGRLTAKSLGNDIETCSHGIFKAAGIEFNHNVKHVNGSLVSRYRLALGG